MDFSGYEQTRPKYDANDNKPLGTFKHEHDGNTFVKHIGLTPKLYVVLTMMDKRLNKEKGSKTD